MEGYNCYNLPVQPTADTLHYNHVHAYTCMYTYVYWHISTHPHIQDGETALHIAAACGHEDVLQLLLEASMDPDMQDEVNMQHEIKIVIFRQH